MLTRKRILLIVSGIVLALMLLSTTLLPAVLKSWLIEEIHQTTGRKTHLQSLAFNPLNLTISAKDFTMEEPDGSTFISIGAIRASLSPASVFRRALILSQFSIDKPTIRILRDGPNHYSFFDIQERLQASKKPKSGQETRFSINNIIIKSGSIDFLDHAVDGGRHHTIRNLEIGVPFISNIPYLVETYTDPRISAVINGALFSFAGKMKPLSKSMETSVRITLKNLDIPDLIAYSPSKPPVRLVTGKLNIDTDVSYRVFAKKQPELVFKGLIGLNDISIDLNNGHTLLKLPLLEINASKLELFERYFQFASIRLERPELFVSRDHKGQWMYQTLIPAESSDTSRKTGASSPPKSFATQQPSLRIASLMFNNGGIHFNDAQPRAGFNGALSDVSFALKNFGNIPGTSASYELSLQMDDGATLKSSGNFSPSPLACKASLTLAGLQFHKAWPYLRPYLTAPVKAGINLSGDLDYSAEKGWTAEHATLALKNISTRYGNGDGLDLALFSINNARFQQTTNSLEIDEISLRKGSASLSLESDGRISLASLIKERTPAPPPSTGAASKRQVDKSTSQHQPSQRQFSYRIKAIRTDHINLAFNDKTREGKPRFTLRNNAVSVNNLKGPVFSPAQVNYSATYGRNTPLRAHGELTPFPFRYRGNIRVTRLPITDFDEYAPENLNVIFLGGYLDTALKLNISIRNGKPEGTFTGSAGVRSFHSIDSVAEEDLLKWESLQLDGFQGKLEPFSLTVRQIALNGVYSRVAILKNRTLNLQNLIEQPTPPSAVTTNAGSGTNISGQRSSSATQATVAAPDPRPNSTSKRQISIGAITIQGGTLAFSDSHLPQRFASTFYNLGGRVSGMSSDDSRFADVDLRGNLENHSPLQITGKINPLRDDLFVDLKISFNDIELSPITPYSATYLGYAVERGKLYLDLNYHIERKELRSENKIFIDQFTFGNKVESKQATNLPVRLGLALLKDRKGEIHLDVPVTGRTDDPQFSIWRLVFQVLKNLLVKAATSPLSLLSSMFGGGSDLSAIQFQQGTSVLAAQEEQKLNALAKALADRPALKIELKGYVDREKDIEGYRVELLERKIQNEKKLAMARQRNQNGIERGESLTVQPDEYTKYLKAVYKKEKFPKPRNLLGLVKDLPDHEMKKLIITNTVVHDGDLQNLARERSTAVMNYLVTKGSVPAERIFIKKDDINRPSEKAPQSRSRVELNAIAP